ncbi:Zinc finger protein aebp2, partial [Cichlidogyrus casuarinus]
MWHGCRVYKTPSVSSGWLERHILTHTQAKGKPYTCIFNHCNQRFSNSELLERHVRRVHLGEDVRGVPCFDRSQPQTPDNINSLSSISQNAELSIKRICKKKKKYRLYKFRAVDFYGDQAQCVVLDRLHLNEIIDKKLGDSPNSDCSSLTTHPSFKHLKVRRLLNTPHH